tara:strand:+ start:2377 stop:3183 length:807 start_codon:yes stop_codon:yes gene_type:complete
MINLLISIFSITFLFSQSPKSSFTQIPSGQNIQTPQIGNTSPQIDPKLQNAIAEYEELIKKHPKKSGLQYNLGNLKYLAGDYEGALNAFRNDLDSEDNNLKSDAIYNMGNSMYSQGKFQESMDFYKQALELSPDDKDAKINYEISKQMLQQQQQQEKNESKNEQSEEKEEEESQEQNKSKNEQSEEKSSKEEENSEEKQDSEEKQNEEQNSSENQEENEEQKQLEQSEEERLEKEEAESILNALQANQKNLMKKKYKAKNRIKLEKDW